MTSNAVGWIGWAQFTERPPRVWGRQGEELRTGLGRGETSTCVGPWIHQDHIHQPDRPPRVWGRLSELACAQSAVGQTPTRVGKASPWSACARSCRTDPHACGEDESASSSRSTTSDGPPRMWGRFRPLGGPYGRRSLPPLQRLSPPKADPHACGEPRWAGPGVRNSPTNPHVRGEDGNYFLGSREELGRPPPAWGGHAGIAHLHLAEGLTPTCVGKTVVANARWLAGTYPHVRWGHRWRAVTDRGIRETPPHLWGGSYRVLPDERRVRKTPTSLGRVPSNCTGAPAATTDPHACGEGFLQPREKPEDMDRPPRIWGNVLQYGPAAPGND